MAFPVEEKYIEKAEGELGAKFPDSFRQKMMRLNGGGVEVGEDYFEIHPFYDTSDKKRIKRTCNSIVHETQTARDHYRLPKNLIVIGNKGEIGHPRFIARRDRTRRDRTYMDTPSMSRIN